MALQTRSRASSLPLRPAGGAAVVLVACAALMAGGARPAAAQTVSPPVGVGPSLPAAPTGGGRATDGRGATITARYRVRQLENVLERAVEHAADLMRRRLQAVTPDVLALAGAPRAQGFRLEGYGLFFSVEVPRLSESVNWALRVLSQDRDARVLASLRKVAAAEQDPALRADLDRAVRSLEVQMAGVASPPPPAAGTRSPLPAPPTPVSASTTADRGEGGPAREEGEAPLVQDAARRPASDPDPDVLANPSAVYEQEVKQALSDALLDYASALDLPDTEWVTVAARDAGYMAFPDSVADMVTVTLSVQVADLQAFRAQRLTRDEARARVVVREF